MISILKPGQHADNKNTKERLRYKSTMTDLVFDDSLRVGNCIIDREHAVLIEHINTLQSVIDGRASRYLVGQILEGLVEYAHTHFYVEEELMRAYKYADFAAHKDTHDKFRSTLFRWVEEHKSGEADFTLEMMAFLKNWLVKHIKETDARLAEFLRGKVLG